MTILPVVAVCLRIFIEPEILPDNLLRVSIVPLLRATVKRGGRRRFLPEQRMCRGNQIYLGSRKERYALQGAEGCAVCESG